MGAGGYRARGGSVGVSGVGGSPLLIYPKTKITKGENSGNMLTPMGLDNRLLFTMVGRATNPHVQSHPSAS